MTRWILFFTILIFVAACRQNQINNEKSTTLITDFEKPEGVSFNVNDVEIADSLLKMDAAKLVFEINLEKKFYFFLKNKQILHL